MILKSIILIKYDFPTLHSLQLSPIQTPDNEDFLDLASTYASYHNGNSNYSMGRGLSCFNADPLHRFSQVSDKGILCYSCGAECYATLHTKEEGMVIWLSTLTNRPSGRGRGGR